MNEWNLDALYTSFQDKKFQEDLNTLKDLNKNYPTYISMFLNKRILATI